MSNDMKWQMTWNDKWHETPNADASHQDDHDADNVSDHKYVLYSLYNEQCAIFVKCLLCEIWEVCMDMNCSGAAHEYEKCAWIMHCSGTGSGIAIVVLLGKWSESCFDTDRVYEILVIALSEKVGWGRQVNNKGWTGEQQRTRQSKLCGFCVFHYWNL